MQPLCGVINVRKYLSQYVYIIWGGLWAKLHKMHKFYAIALHNFVGRAPHCVVVGGMVLCQRAKIYICLETIHLTCLQSRVMMKVVRPRFSTSHTQET